MSPFLSSEELEKAAEDFLEKYHPTREIPIPIENIVEFDLGLEVIPVQGLQKAIGMDGSLSIDFMRLYIDKYQFENYPNRLRFTMAHEAGHFVLHREYVESLEIKTKEQWIKVVRGDKGKAPLETQANMFAGFLLMPGDKIKPLFDREKEKVVEVFKKNKKPPPNDLLQAEYIANPLANIFHVSEASAALRLKNWVNFGR